MSEPASNLADFQRGFGAHLREPRQNPRPAGTSARRMAVYVELVHNNIAGFLNTCFPVARQTLGERRWGPLVRHFIATHRGETPYFREIPLEFLTWFQSTAPGGYPAWLPSLLHYEWAELAVDTMAVDVPACNPAADAAHGTAVLNPAMLLLAYDWPVQRIGPTYRPRKPAPVQLLVYRDADDAVRFMQLNPVTARLIALLQAGEQQAAELLAQLAAELGYADRAAFIGFGMQVLQELQREGVVLGYRAAPS
ncbi:MAG: putative DNA-binding domain-containing protein [Delftia acidovorans]|nr:putative DNA-binding domain-containing protein [Delftia acidovorans]